MLGGSNFQVPSIITAKNEGHYVITCDYLPENPGHKYSDEYHNVSTTNFDAVLQLAEKLNIDGIVAYASDPAAPTAAYVAEKLGLKFGQFLFFSDKVAEEDWTRKGTTEDRLNAKDQATLLCLEIAKRLK